MYHEISMKVEKAKNGYVVNVYEYEDEKTKRNDDYVFKTWDEVVEYFRKNPVGDLPLIGG